MYEMERNEWTEKQNNNDMNNHKSNCQINE